MIPKSCRLFGPDHASTKTPRGEGPADGALMDERTDMFKALLSGRLPVTQHY
ncbi:hypothetical protein ABMA32_04620 [Mesorhizobium sp. VNQ89]|uniref:hypothetical protein n=1 Tax=Mesorhizobium quangtriensis TaxID=3157709 RepID=UPI0032B80504